MIFAFFRYGWKPQVRAMPQTAHKSPSRSGTTYRVALVEGRSPTPYSAPMLKKIQEKR